MPAKIAPFLNAGLDIFSHENLLRCENSKIIHRGKQLVLMIKKKQRAKRGGRKRRRVPAAHGVSLKVIPVGFAHLLARYFRRQGVDACLGEVENH